ncbi:MAG: EamA family transporter [Chloroflexota bacterium]
MRSPFARTALPGEVLMVLVAILWGSAFPVTRLLLDEMPPLGAAAWRTLLAAAVVAAFAALRGEFGLLWPVPEDRPRLAGLAVLGGALFLIGMNLGIFLTVG